MDPKQFISRSNARGFIAVARDLIAIGATIAICIAADHWVITVLGIWIIGFFQFTLGEILTHEASHWNLFATRRLNDHAELILTLPFFFTLADYRREHIEHHQLLSTRKEQLYHDYDYLGLMSENVNWVWIWFIRPIVGYAGLFYLRSLIEISAARSWLKIGIFWLFVIAAAIATNTWHYLILYWIVPILWSYSSFFYWSEIEDHFNTRTGTRSNIGSMNLLIHNSGFHHTHHQYPTIPWYNLRMAHNRLTKHQSDESKGFFDTFKQISTPKKDAVGAYPPPES